MEGENKKITKIVINTEDELTDIVTNILESPNERIILTFAEESDLLISPINLKVVQETADEQEKLLIAQIIKNPTGVKNAHTVGITTIETTTLPTDDLWEKEVEKRAERLAPKPIVKEVVEETPKEQDKDDEVDKKTVVEGIISIDEDLPTVDKEEKQEDVKDLSTKDFSSLKKQEKDSLPSSKKRVLRNRRKLSTKSKKLLISGGVGALVLLGLITFIYYKTAPYVKIKMYIESREAAIEKIFTGDENIKEVNFEEGRVPIKKESVEKERSSTVKATGTAYRGEKAKGEIMITNYDTDGCPDKSPIILEAGHTLTSSGGKIFKIDKQMTFDCSSIGPQVVKITANDIGEEYNLTAGANFTIQNYSGSKMIGLAQQAITGGSKEQYSILSQVDVNNAVEELKKIAIEEGERELKDKSGGSWEIIGDSIQSDVVKDSIKTDISVGSKAKETTLNLKTTSNATFFMKDGFDDKIAELLTQDAQEKNLFETEKDLELTLSDDIEKEITVVENTPESTKIKLVAKGFVKPKIEKATVIDAIKGKKWEEGMKILKGFVFSEKETEIVFEPPSFPKQLKYFPTRQGRIFLEFITDAL